MGSVRVRLHTCEVAEVRLGEVKKVSRGQHAATLPLAPPVQVSSSNVVSVKEDLDSALMHTHYCASATEGRCAYRKSQECHQQCRPSAAV